MAQKTFRIEWPDDYGPEWMNADNLMLCLNAYCKGVDLKVVEEAPDAQDETG